jgi:hypothetical protein
MLGWRMCEEYACQIRERILRRRRKVAIPATSDSWLVQQQRRTSRLLVSALAALFIDRSPDGRPDGA